MMKASRRRGPIYWTIGLGEALNAFSAANLRRSQESLLYFVTMRSLIPAIGLGLAMLVRHSGILPDRTSRWMVIAMLLGAAGVFLMTIRDVQRWRRRRSSDWRQTGSFGSTD
jgi:hypothetical protein